MKKYWSIKPWMFIVAIVVVAGSLLYALGDFGNSVLSKNSDSGYGMDYASDEMAVTNQSSMPMADMVRTQSVSGGEIAYDSDEGIQSEERMIIRNGYLSMVVDDVRDSAKKIADYAEQNGGFLVNSNVDKSGIELYGSVTIRIPSELFDESMEFVKEMGDIESETVDGRDITEEYTDLEAKLENLRATEKQFLSILKEAKEIQDILAVQRELMYVRENIESIEGRIKYLSESVDLSSLTVYLSTDPSKLPVVDEEDKWKPIAVIKDALRSLLVTGTEIVNGLIWLVVYIPVIAVLLFIVWIIRRRLRKGKNKKK